MVREIPNLSTLCLRVVGSHSCSADETFASDPKTGQPSKASQLLRAFHKRPVILSTEDRQVCLDVAAAAAAPKAPNDEQQQDTAAAAAGDTETKTGNKNDSSNNSSIQHVPLPRTLCVGLAASRRAQANEVDLNHPLVAHRYHATAAYEIATSQTAALVMEHASPALDCLQSYIDALVELGRMDDGRLGLHFFEEWRANVLTAAGKPVPLRKKTTDDNGDDNTNENEIDNKDENQEEESGITSPPPRKRSRRRSSASIAATTTNTSGGNTATTTTLRFRVKQGPPPPLGSLSLNNCAVAEETVEAMRDSGLGIHLAVLDLTGIYSLNDTMLEMLLPHCPNLQRLSLKNCRRVTVSSLSIIAQFQTKLKFLDVGGTYNVTPDEVLDTIVIGTTNTNSQPCPQLIELHASGLGWNDMLFKTLVDGRKGNVDSETEDNHAKDDTHPPARPWKALSVGFSQYLTAVALRKSLSQISSTLISLSLHFCETVVDNALMGILGRNLPHVRYLDVRGNPALSSMTGWYDGRASADFHITMPKMADGATAAGDQGEEEEDGVQPLTVLARFTGITKASLEDTLRIHPLQAAKLECVLDSGGIGVGIYR